MRPLGRADIEARIPHRGRMCLLDRLVAWDDRTLNAAAAGHGAPDHPLRTERGLLAPCAVEYAAQAMALHGALRATADGRPGYLASVRQVRCHVARLDDVPGELLIRVEWQAGDAGQVMYRFTVADDSGRALVEGRALVVLDADVMPLGPEGAGAAR